MDVVCVQGTTLLSIWFCLSLIYIDDVSPDTITRITFLWWWRSCWCVPFQVCGTEGDRWRNPFLIAHSCFSFHPPGGLTSPSTQRCFQIKYYLMNWKTCPHQALSVCVCVHARARVCVCVCGLHVGRAGRENERKTV